MTALKIEFLKVRGRGLGLIVGAMLAVELLWMLRAFRTPDASDLEWGWMQLLYNIPLLRGIVFPTLAGVTASKLGDLEHKSGSLRLLRTIQTGPSLFAAKFFCGGIYVLAATGSELLLLTTLGFLKGFQNTPGLWAFLLTFLFDFATGMELFTLSLALSMTIRNQAVPLCIAAGGSFAGLMLMLLPRNFLTALLPWGHIGALAFIGMDWTKETGFQGMHYLPVNWSVFALSLLFIGAAYQIGNTIFCRRES